MRELAGRRVEIARRTQKRRRAVAPARPSAGEVLYQSILRALRGHPSRETEDFLVLAARDWHPTCRAAAIGSLGWWDPLQRQVFACLQDARRDPSTEVRQTARAALARLGERQALHGFRLALSSEDPQRIRDTVQLVASEGLTLLWPDLDRLADSLDPEIANDAREALKRLNDDFVEQRR